MKASFYLIALLQLASFSGLSQIGWMTEFISAGYASINKMSIDSQNNIYAVGTFDGGLTFQGNSYSGFGSFLVKLDKEGNIMWHRKFTPSNKIFIALSLIETDAIGNIYVAGQFPENINLGTTNLTGEEHNSFLAKFDSNGALVWTKSFIHLQEIFDIGVNNVGDIVVYGGLSYGTLLLDNMSLPIGPNAFAIVYSSSGQLLWARTLGNPNVYTTWPIGAAIDDSRNVYLNGRWHGDLTLDNFQINSTQYYDMFITKLNPAGKCLWITTALRKNNQQTPTNPPSGLTSEYGDIRVNDSGSLYVVGTHYQELKIGSITHPGSTDPNSINTFTCNLSPDGSIVWSRAIASFGHMLGECATINRNNFFISGVLGNSPYFSILDPASGSAIEPQIIPLSNVDISTGHGIDSDENIYLSGRRKNTQSEPLRGYILKVVDPRTTVGDAKPIQGQTSICQAQPNLQLTTDPIPNATSYEWIIKPGNGNIQISIETEQPKLAVSISDLSLSGNFTVIVRGKNSQQTGKYSISINITIDSPLGTLTLTRSCNYILVKEGISFTWLKNGNPFSNSTIDQSKLYPDGPGEFQITSTNSCGTVWSNKIEFNSLNQDNIFIPNVITPNNGDEWNENFIIDDKLVMPSLLVVDRWGKEVFMAKPYANNWNGASLPGGIYFYQVTSECFNKPLVGSISIVR